MFFQNLVHAFSSGSILDGNYDCMFPFRLLSLYHNLWISQGKSVNVLRERNFLPLKTVYRVKIFKTKDAVVNMYPTN